MIEFAVFAGVWVACSIAAYNLFVDDWTRQFDYTSDDRLCVVILSLLGPISLGAALICWFFGLPRKSKQPNLIKPKKNHH